jgi:molecular chaperone GrpE
MEKKKPTNGTGEAMELELDPQDRPTHDAETEEEPAYRVDDRRHWMRGEQADEPETEVTPARPSIVDEYRERAEAAEAKLQEYIEAFKSFRAEQDDYRLRLDRDVTRRVEQQFGGMVAELLETVDNLDLALSHASEIPEAEPLAKGVALARDRFLATLERAGIEKIVPDDEPFDPNEAEALRLDPVDSEEADGKVTETMRPGYRLGDQLIRPARVAVGRKS